MPDFLTKVANSKRNLTKASAVLENEFNEQSVIKRSEEEFLEELATVERGLWVVQQKLKLLDDYPEKDELLRRSGKDGNFAKQHREKLAKGLSSDYKPFNPLPIHDLMLWLYAGLVRKEALLYKKRRYFLISLGSTE